jgi:hypothetical protein
MEIRRMWRSSRTPDGADTLRRSLSYAPTTRPIGIVGKSLRQNVRAGLPFSILERGILIFALKVAVGFIACAGAILALFAWSGAGL